jgi:protein-tyrosine phosphatase
VDGRAFKDGAFAPGTLSVIDRGPDHPYRLLVLCTANQCRSPMAAGLLARRLSEARVHAELRSAGVLEAGRPAWPEAAAVMAERGMPLDTHRSRMLEPRYVADADLVLGMAREHVREAVALDPSAFGRAFTLKELVRLGEASPRRGQPLEGWLEGLSAHREVTDLLGASEADDVEDPIGRPIRAFRDTADELDALVVRLQRVAWPNG